MTFRTKLDYSDNRQIKQTERTHTILSGGTAFGLSFSALTSGPDPDFSGISVTQVNIVSTFSGNTGSTVYSWYDNTMELGLSALSAITSLNSGTTQNTNNIFTASNTTIIDGNTVNLAYTGVNFDISVIGMVDLGGSNFSGSVLTVALQSLTANTLDFTGRTIWVDVSGITRTQNLIITENPVIGYVWKCLDAEGRGYWGADASGTTGSTTYWSAGTGTNAIVQKYSNGVSDGILSVSEGSGTTADGNYSHAEGALTSAGGVYSHAEGGGCVATGIASHAEGIGSIAIGDYSHAQGSGTYASGTTSHAEGNNSNAYGESSHAEGDDTQAVGNNSHSEGSSTYAFGINSHAEGYATQALGVYSHSEGQSTTAFGTRSHSEGYLAIASGTTSHAEGNETQAKGSTSHAEGNLTIALGDYSHAQGNGTYANGLTSHAEGNGTTASGDYSHAEGVGSIASGYTSHAEGAVTIASGVSSHAEGYITTASGPYSHTEGFITTAFGDSSHAGGSSSIASGSTSFIHSTNSIVLGDRSVVLGGQNLTGATNDYVYVSSLNINSVGSSAFANDIRIDATGNLTTNTSDIRFKENINTIIGALDKVKQLRGVNYQWKDKVAGGDSIKLGFIAQEVDLIEPNLVFTNKVDGYKGIHIDGIIPLLVEAVKELANGVTLNNTTLLETQTILAEDNNIELNYSGNNQTSIGGGITVLHALGDNLNADLKTDINGNWITNNDFKPKHLTIPIYTPTSSSDVNGSLGNITTDEEYLYLKLNDKWKRIKLEDF